VFVSRSLLIAGAVVVLLAACSPSQAPTGAATAAPQATAPVPPLAGMDPAAVPAGQNRGKVVQTQNGGAGYTYAEVQLVTGQKVWMAGKQIDLKPGTQVEWGNSTVMRDFPSKSLGRTFEQILFVDTWNEIGKAPVGVVAHGNNLPAGHPAMGAEAVPGGAAAAAAMPGAMPGAGNAAAMAPAMPMAGADASGGGAVKTVTNAAGYSFIEVDQGGGKSVWVAAMQTPMKAGDQVKWQGGMTMNNFTAKSLGKTFDKIVFASALSVGK
jgi:hypothetical protein